MTYLPSFHVSVFLYPGREALPEYGNILKYCLIVTNYSAAAVFLLLIAVSKPYLIASMKMLY